jgi:predicted transcriptional regulator
MKIPKFRLNSFRRPREIAITSLGKLEREVMNEVWRREETSVRDVYLAFGEAAAYTTLMTTLDRLFKKGFIKRRKDGRAFIYSARFSREDLERGITEDVIEGLLEDARQPEPILQCFVDAVSERDSDLLDELERLVREKRRELNQSPESLSRRSAEE